MWRTFERPRSRAALLQCKKERVVSVRRRGARAEVIAVFSLCRCTTCWPNAGTLKYLVFNYQWIRFMAFDVHLCARTSAAAPERETRVSRLTLDFQDMDLGCYGRTRMGLRGQCVSKGMPLSSEEA